MCIETYLRLLCDIKYLLSRVFSHNQLTSLPVEVCALKNLRSLTLQKNLLENLPEELGELECLTELVTSTHTHTHSDIHNFVVVVVDRSVLIVALI